MQTKLSYLTPDQASLVATFSERFKPSIKPANRALAEASLVECYRQAALVPPTVLVWAQSPVVAIVAGAVAAHQVAGGRVRKLPESLFKKTRLQVECAFTRDVYALAAQVLDVVKPTKRGIQNANFRIPQNVSASTATKELTLANVTSPATRLDQRIEPNVRRYVTPLLSNKQGTEHEVLIQRVLTELYDELDPASPFTRTIELTIDRAFAGPSQLGRAAYECFFGEVGEIESGGQHFSNLVASCGHVWPHKDFAVLSDRPYAIAAEPRLKLYYRDSWSFEDVT